jgi:ABC-type transporter lipoprotein component MlaA
MTDSNQTTEDASVRFNRTVKETTERLEREAVEFIKYVNDNVVPNVRQQSTKALRTAAEKLQQLANYMEQHSIPPK